MLCANMTQSTSISEGEAIQTSENMPKTRTIPDENTAFFQKRHRLSGCLPYSARLEETRCKQWHQLKEHFSSALLEGGHSLKVWIKQMDAYLSVHRFAFSKTEHIQLVTGLWSAVQHLDDDLPTMAKVVPLLNQLLSKPHLLTRDDLQEVDWRSLYRLFLLVDGKHPAAKKRTLRPPIGFSTDFRVLIRSFKLYFAVSATAEVLDHFKPKLCVYGQNYATVLGELDLFLPTAIIISSQQKSDHELWFTGLLRCWFQNPLESKLENLYVIFFSEVAKQLNGHLDWEPYLPQIFDRLRHLMTTDSDWTKVKISIFTFIVYLINEQSSALEKMKALYSSGSAGNKLLSYSDALTELLEKFVQRARAERKAVEQGYWYFSTPPSHRLTPELIDHFAEFIFDEVIFERLELGDSGLPVKTLNKLALLCTETFARRLLFQKWALAVERASEPDRKRSALKLMAVFLYPVLKNRSEEIKSAYANQMDSLLVETLSSLSTTDEQFAYYQLLLLRSIIWLKIGGVHCASSFASSFDWNAFTESFIGVCFILVESNCETMFSTVNGDDMKELIFEILQYSLAAIEDEEQCSNHIDRIISFVFGQITDQRHAMRLLSEMLYVVMGANRHETVQLYAISKILLTLKTNIFSAIDNEAAFADTCQSQLMHNLRLLQTFFNLPDGRLLLRHETEIIDLLTTVYDLQFDYHFKWSNVVFSFPLDLLFFSLNCFYLVKQPYNFTMASFSGTNELLHQVLPEDLPVRWHTPSEEEINFVRRLLKTFIGPQIQFLQNFVASSSLNSAKEPTFFAQLEKAIMFLVSLDSLVKLKNYKYPPLVTDSDDSINEHSFKYHNLNNNCCLTDLFSLDEEIDLFGKQTEFSKVSNFSFVHELIKLLTAVSTKLRHSEINVDISFLLENITDICNFCLFPNKVGGGPSLATHHTRTEHVFTADLFKPAGDHRRLPPIQAQRLNDYNRKVRKALQVQSSELVFTAAHQVATTHLLLDLALDQSSEVRQSAQSVLNSMWTTFPGTFERYAVPRLLTALTQYESNYEAFKGALYVLFGRGTTTDSPLISGGWREILLPLWPALLAVNWAEKPAIAFFVDDKLIKLVYVLRTHPIVLKEDNFQAVKTAVFKLDQFFFPSEEQCFKIEKTRKQISLLNECSYLQLIESLLSILNKQKLHWRFYQLGMDMLITLIRFDIPLPETAVEFFLSSLIHDSKKIRDDAVLATNRFLFQHCRPKRKLLKMNDSSYRSLDCLGNFSADQTYYEKTVFIDYFTEGFQVSPDASFEVHAPDTAEQCSQYSLVVKKFTNEKFLDTFFHLMIASVDEAQEGNLKCDWAFVKLWKYLFQSFKLFNNHLLFFSRIEAMLNKKKLAAECKTLEVLVGLAKAMPWFSYEDLTTCKQFFEQVVFEKHLKKFDAKADSAWFFLFYGFFQNRDLRRSVWVWRGLFEGKVLETFGGSSETDQVIDMKGITVSPITISSWINWSKSAVKRNWRFPLFNEQVVRQLENGNFLNHPYKDVRVEVASLLSYLFRPERLSLSLSNSSITKSRQLFVKNVVEKLKLMLSPLLKLSYSSSESFSLADEDSMLQLQKTLFDRETENGQELLQLLDTVGRFVDACLKSIYYADGKDFFPLLPYFCVVHTNNTDPIDDTLLEVVGLMAKQLFSAEDVRETGLLSILEQISSSRSTNTRKMAAGFMISFTAKNAFVLREDNQLKKSWLTILLKLLFDEHLTVRLFAQKAMLYVWQLVLSGKTETRLALIEEFKEILKRKNSSPEIREKHGAILGLCALVEATPDSVPNYLPSLLLYLRGWIAEPQPVSETIKSTLRSFRASHIENWVQFKKAFTEEQLNQLDSVLVSNFYFT